MQKPGLFGMNGFMVLLLTCFSFAARAQQTGYLILIDAENKQAFTVRVGNQSFFSSSHGHLVLSQLKDSTYKLSLRLPKKNIADQVFTVPVHQKDLGFQLKGIDSSLVLYNWQTREIIHPVYEKDSSRMLEQGIKRDDGFSRLMAAVVNDTAVMYNTYAGNGFEHDSSIVQNLAPNVQRLTPDTLISASDQHATPNDLTSTISRQLPALNRDSLLSAKRQEIHLRDSLNAARKTASRDSLIAARKQQSIFNDSLNKAQKAAVKDSLVMVKNRPAYLKDSLLGVNRENVLNDSLLDVIKANFLKDSLELSKAKRPTTNDQRPTVGGHRSSLVSGVKKLREVSLKISRKLVFLDIDNDGRADTITLFVYFETEDTAVKKRLGGEPLAVKKPAPPDTTGVKKSQLRNKNSDTTELSKTSAKNKNSDTTGSSKAIVKKPASKPDDATTCGQIATEADTETLRSAILKANSEQEKISVAAGAFALKCFSVSQVRFLASLLVSDKAKYGLMDAAHQHITDRDRFPELVDMLTDKNFQRKFLVMAEKRS